MRFQMGTKTSLGLSVCMVPCPGALCKALLQCCNVLDWSIWQRKFQDGISRFWLANISQIYSKNQEQKEDLRFA